MPFTGYWTVCIEVRTFQFILCLGLCFQISNSLVKTGLIFSEYRVFKYRISWLKLASLSVNINVLDLVNLNCALLMLQLLRWLLVHLSL